MAVSDVVSTDKPLKFSNIGLGGKAAYISGEFKIEKHGFNWHSKGGQKVNLSIGQVKSASWIRLGALFQLRLSTQNDVVNKFDGFKESDHEKLSSALKSYFGLELSTIPISTRGWNWGSATVAESSLKFKLANEMVFELPLGEVVSANCAKKDITLTFNQDDAEYQDVDSLVEMRFWVPNTRQENGKETLSEYEESKSKTSAEQLTEDILSHVIPTNTKPLLVLEHLSLLTPHGRYDLEMFPTFLRMHGKTDHRIKYSHITRMFQLPRPDNKCVFFVVSLEPAIRQGHTSYPHLVFQLSTQEKVELKPNLPENGEELSKFAGFKEALSGPLFEVVTRAFQHLVGKKITTPNKVSGFKSHESSGHCPAIKCSLRADDGYLYPLERSFFFVHKPPTYIRFEEIIGIEFLRHGIRSLDFRIKMQTGSVQFSAIHKDEYSNLFNFVSSKGLKILNFSSDHSMDTPYYSEEVPRDQKRRAPVDADLARRPSRRAATESRQKTRYEIEMNSEEGEESDEEFDESAEEEEEDNEVIDEEEEDDEN